MSELATEFHEPLLNVLRCVADDKLFLGHRNSDWTGIAPILEADIAFSSLAQDDIAHASAFYELMNTISGEDPDQIAFGRAANAYRCADIVTKSDDFNWANAIARQFYCNLYDYHRLLRLSNCTWSPLATLAKRICAEQAVHVDHVGTWITHLGNGNNDSKHRLQTALDAYAPYAAMLSEKPEGFDTLLEGGVFTDEGCLFTQWKEHVDTVLDSVGMKVTLETPSGLGGRMGSHDEDFLRSLTELQEVFSTDPLAAW
ncbi:MAG: phenylacetate-CoA oxygenase subunit PaaC [Planctomycetes bacterium]|nr:phenylacetate-CoA oxygenase subunit PaaC [Planctomycetota bacterium]